MTTLRWSEALSLDHALMDETHQEFVELLGQVERADDASLLPAWHALLSHTESHFGQEDRWMRDTGFAPENCHTLQHRTVLRAMREVVAPGREARQQHALMREMASALAPWFVQHAQAMDAALAQHLRAVAYDAQSGRIHTPQALPRAPLRRCGSQGCAGAARADALATASSATYTMEAAAHT